MKFGLFRRRQALKVTKIAGIPLHGEEGNKDGVLLHLSTAKGETLMLEVPRQLTSELRDFLTRAIGSLDHWDQWNRQSRKSRVIWHRV